MSYLRRRWILAALLCVPALAAATSCRRPSYDRDDGRRWFGPAERVFIGDLEQVDDPRGPEGMLAAPGGSVRGRFRPREAFKGSNETVSIRINPGVRPDRNYLVFAHRDGNELRADGECAFEIVRLSDPILAPLKNSIEGLLAWLRTLPPAGSGGELRVYLRDDAKRAAPGTGLHFEGPRGALSLRLDEQGYGQLDSAAAGAYRLTTPAPPGYRYACYPDCAQLVVHDRGLDEYSIQLNPTGSLRVQVVAADGKPIQLAAQFDLYRPDGRRVGPLGSTLSRYEIANGQDDAAVGFVEPGRYVLALVLPAFSPDGRRTTDLRRHFDLGTAIAEAPVVDVHEGDNVSRFRLPAMLRPVLVRVHFSGEPVYETLHMAGWHMLTGHEIGANSEAMIDSPLSGETALTFHLIPGQTLQYTLYGYDINGTREVLLLRPEHDADIDLNLHKR